MGNTAAAGPPGYLQPGDHMHPGQQAGCGRTIVGLLALVGAVVLGALLAFAHIKHKVHLAECEMEELPPLWAYTPLQPQLQVKILSYNLFWWQLFDIQKTANGAPFHLITNSDQPMPYDFMGFQECEDGAFLLRGAQLLDQYTWYAGMGTKTTAICIAFLTRNWEHLDHGIELVGEDSPAQFFGTRAAQWVRARHRERGQTVFFMNHHGPTPINSGGKCGGGVIANRLLSIIHSHGQPGDAVVVVGDFNAMEGSPTVAGITQQMQRAFGGVCDGGIDHVFVNPGATRVIAQKNLGPGGSDHDALAVILGF